MSRASAPTQTEKSDISAHNKRIKIILHILGNVYNKIQHTYLFSRKAFVDAEMFPVEQREREVHVDSHSLWRVPPYEINACKTKKKQVQFIGDALSRIVTKGQGPGEP